MRVRKKLTVKEAGEKEINDTNYFFNKTSRPIFINKMNNYDLKICHFRSMISQYCLAWNNYEHYLNDDKCYIFCFKYITLPNNSIINKPESTCICTYNIFDNCISIEIIQSFARSNSIINGNIMKYSLITLFLTRIEGNGIYLINPVNEKIKKLLYKYFWI